MSGYFLVEDHVLMRQGVIDYLSSHGNYVCSGTAKDKEEFFSAMKKGGEGPSPDIIITDLCFGSDSKGGINLIRECRSKFPNLKIMVYSMYDTPGVVKAALDSGADGYVCKNSDVSYLASGLKELMQGHNYIDPSLATEVLVFEKKLAMFTRREMDILNLIMDGKTNDEIAATLGVQKRAVENYISRIYNKSGMSSREELRHYWSMQTSGHA